MSIVLSDGTRGLGQQAQHRKNDTIWYISFIDHHGIVDVVVVVVVVAVVALTRIIPSPWSQAMRPYEPKVHAQTHERVRTSAFSFNVKTVKCARKKRRLRRKT